MAYDKIIPIHTRLDRRISYALNPAKTIAGEQRLCAAINCRLDSACRDMLDTKRRWDKENRPVQGYHIIHSYAPGEVTAEQAQALSLEFAERLLQGRFEAVVATHVDHAHIHSHIVFSSVSCTDGGMFRDDFKAYYGDIRSISNAISREHGLSVIEPKGRGKHYVEWEAEKRGKPTVRGLVRRDVDTALASAVSMQTFFAALEKQGYAVKRGPRVKHTAIRPPGAERFIRLDSLGTGYTEGELKARIGSEKQLPPRTAPVAKRYRVRRKPMVYTKPKGLRRLYLHYLYLLAPPKRCKPKFVPFTVKAEVRRLSQYKRQYALLQKYRIESESQLPLLADALQAEIDSLIFTRRELYRRKRRGEDMSKEIGQINLALQPLRRELRCCQQTAERIPQMQEQIQLTRQSREGSNITKGKELKQHGSER